MAIQAEQAGEAQAFKAPRPPKDKENNKEGKEVKEGKEGSAAPAVLGEEQMASGLTAFRKLVALREEEEKGDLLGGASGEGRRVQVQVAAIKLPRVSEAQILKIVLPHHHTPPSRYSTRTIPPTKPPTIYHTPYLSPHLPPHLPPHLAHNTHTTPPGTCVLS